LRAAEVLSLGGQYSKLNSIIRIDDMMHKNRERIERLFRAVPDSDRHFEFWEYYRSISDGRSEERRQRRLETVDQFSMVESDIGETDSEIESNLAPSAIDVRARSAPALVTQVAKHHRFEDSSDEAPESADEGQLDESEEEEGAISDSSDDKYGTTRSRRRGGGGSERGRPSSSRGRIVSLGNWAASPAPSRSDGFGSSTTSKQQQQQQQQQRQATARRSSSDFPRHYQTVRSTALGEDEETSDLDGYESDEAAVGQWHGGATASVSFDRGTSSRKRRRDDVVFFKESQPRKRARNQHETRGNHAASRRRGGSNPRLR